MRWLLVIVIIISLGACMILRDDDRRERTRTFVQEEIFVK